MAQGKQPEPVSGDDLAAAAAGGLAAVGDPVVDNKHGQTTLQPVWRAKFLGASYDSPSDDNPKMDEERTFLVTGVAKKHTEERRKDGELRETWHFDVTDVQPAPEGGPA